jgi:putative tryptophan/tyrosine transport system substrate-binding protein
MKRRTFIAALGATAGSLVARPLVTYAQQGERVRRVSVLLGAGLGAEDSDARARVAAFQRRLLQLGWIDGRNIALDIRWGAGDADRVRRYAAELAALAPDVILTSGGSTLGPLLQATRTVPIVFVGVADPVGAGFVDSLARPGGNATGFTQFEFNLSGKWLELLKEIAPTITRAAILRDPAISAGIGQFAVIQAAAPTVGVDVRPINLRDAGEIERAVAAFAHDALASGASGQRANPVVRAPATSPESGSSARTPNGGMIVTASALSFVHRDLIFALATRYKLPAVYSSGYFVNAGGLTSYGYNILDQYRAAASYVDRILKGENPSNLPVQAPVKYELAINLKAARAIGLEVPATLLARADEVIE